MGGARVVFQASYLESWHFLKMMRRWVRQMGLCCLQRWCVRWLPSLSRATGRSALVRTVFEMEMR
jgi:hypothetical protein